MPEWKPEILRRLAPLRLAPTREAEIADELAQHLEDRYQELHRTGYSEEEASVPPSKNLKGKTCSREICGLLRVTCIASPSTLGKSGSNFFSGILQDIRLRSPHAAQISRLHRRRRAHARAGDRREHRHFQLH